MPVPVAISIPYMGYVTIGICSFTISLYLILFFLVTGSCYRAQIKDQMQVSEAEKKNGLAATTQKKIKMKPHSCFVETTFDLYQPLCEVYLHGSNNKSD